MQRKSLTETIKLSEDQKKKILSEIRAFYLDTRGEDIGIIEEQQILDLFCEHLAPIVYNRALEDAQRWMREQMDNLEADYYLMYKDVR